MIEDFSSANELKTQAEQLLPLIKSGSISKADVEELLNRLRIAIKADPSKGKELGQLLSSINQAIKTQPAEPGINRVPVANGLLAIGHKPGGKISFEGMKQIGVTAVVTLLHEDEGAQNMAQQLKKVNIHWIWFPFSASHPHDGEETIKVFQLYEELEGLLNKHGKIYIHCSAGIHRTGMITYGLLRYLGKEKAEALQLLHALREVTAIQAGEERLAWGDQFSR